MLLSVRSFWFAASMEIKLNALQAEYDEQRTTIQELQSEVDGHKEKESQDVCQTMCSVNFPLVLTPSAGRSACQLAESSKRDA